MHKFIYEQNLDSYANIKPCYDGNFFARLGGGHNDGSGQNGRNYVHRIYWHLCCLDGRNAGDGRLQIKPQTF